MKNGMQELAQLSGCKIYADVSATSPFKCGNITAFDGLGTLVVISNLHVNEQGWAITAMGGEHRGLKVIRKGVTRCLVDNWRPSSMIRYVKLSLDRRKMKVKGESCMNMVI